MKVLAGKALVFWDADAKQIKGISVTDKINIEVYGNIYGDIVTNLTPTGFLTDSDFNPSNGLDGGRLLSSSIAGVKVNSYIDQFGVAQNGDVGRIIAGGSISNVNLAGNLAGIYAGDGIFDAVATGTSTGLADGIAATTFTYTIGFDFDGAGPLNSSAMTLAKLDASFASMASINGAKFAGGVNVQLFAGDGFDGVTGTAANGGSISNVSFVGATSDITILTDFFASKSYTISAGDGGSGATTGGNGGFISGVTETGSNGIVVIKAGAGGNGTSKGGVGGAISLLDLQGTPDQYNITAGDGGNGAVGGAGGAVNSTNIASLTTSQFITLAGDFITGEDCFFVINRGSGEMTLVNGSGTASTIMVPPANGPVDALAEDLNGDGHLDVAIAYNDGNFGVFMNNGSSSFVYSAGQVGFSPAKVLVGDFLGDGDGKPDLVFVGTTTTSTTIKMFQVTDEAAFATATPSDAYTSASTIIKPLTLSTGNLADAVGGGFSSAGTLDLDEDGKADIFLGFQDGTIQGILSSGNATLASPFTFVKATDAKMFTTATGGIRDLDFNFAGTTGEERLAVIDKAGQAAYVFDAMDLSAASTALPLPDASTFGTLLQIKWTNTDPTPDSGGAILTVVSSQSTSSKVFVFDHSLALRDTYAADYLVNSTANNFLRTSGEADSYIFCTADVTSAQTYAGYLPSGSLTTDVIDLPFLPKGINVYAGNGGTGTTGAGGAGGNIVGINIDANAADIHAGNGGISALGAGGSGGSINNTLTFTTPAGVLITPGFSATVNLTIAAGNGADATGSASNAKGGNGGSLTGLLFVFSDFLTVTAGDGGDSQWGSAGIGGSVTNTTIYNANDVSITAGTGGTATLSAKAPGGKGGSIINVVAGELAGTITDPVTGDVTTITEKIVTGNLVLTAGNGGNSSMAKGGDGGAITGVTVQNTWGLQLYAGIGGDATGVGSKGKGGIGGSIKTVTAGIIASNGVVIAAGDGGNSVGGGGGVGGSVNTVSLTLNPSDSDVLDETLAVIVSGGNGGDGASGGAGGSIIALDATGVYDETTGVGTVINSIAMLLVAGNGGNGSTAGGGNGGSVKIYKPFLGISEVDPDSLDVIFAPTDEALRVFAGDGGDGLTKGGAGGSISGIRSGNVLNSASQVIPVNLLGGALIQAGDGGDATTGKAGNGGSITGLSLGVEGQADYTGNIRLNGGDGGSATVGTGGAGGGITNSTLVCIKGNNALGYGIFGRAGDGGAGTTKGGAGGKLSNISVTLPQVGVNLTDPDIYSAVFLAGNGGNGTGGLKSGGGAGGDISGIKQTKDVYSVINLIQAGKGGNSSMDIAGGRGGNVKSLYTVGSIGAQDARALVTDPLNLQGQYNTVATSSLIDGLFGTTDVQQGIYAGLGGSGFTSGANGSVTGIKARAIAAIGAADRNGTFQKATKVSSISTLFIAYDIDSDGIYDTGDGFVMAKSFTGLKSLDKTLISDAQLLGQTAGFLL